MYAYNKLIIYIPFVPGKPPTSNTLPVGLSPVEPVSKKIARSLHTNPMQPKSNILCLDLAVFSLAVFFLDTPAPLFGLALSLAVVVTSIVMNQFN